MTNLNECLFFIGGGVLLIALGIRYKPPRESGYGKLSDLLWTTKGRLLITGCGSLIVGLKLLAGFLSEFH